MRQLSPFALYLMLAISPLGASAATPSRGSLASSIAETLRQSSQEKIAMAAITECDADLSFELPTADGQTTASRRIVFSFAKVDPIGSEIRIVSGASPVLELQASSGVPAFRQIFTPQSADGGPEFSSRVLLPLQIATDAAQALADDISLLARLCQPEHYGVESTGSLDVAAPALTDLWKTSTPRRRVDVLGEAESVEVVRQEIQSCQLFSDLKITPEGKPSQRYFERAHVDLGDARAAWARIEPDSRSGGYLLHLGLPAENVIQTLWHSSRSGSRTRRSLLTLPFSSESSALRFAGGIRHMARSCPARKPPSQMATTTSR